MIAVRTANKVSLRYSRDALFRRSLQLFDGTMPSVTKPAGNSNSKKTRISFSFRPSIPDGVLAGWQRHDYAVSPTILWRFEWRLLNARAFAVLADSIRLVETFGSSLKSLIPENGPEFSDDPPTPLSLEDQIKVIEILEAREARENPKLRLVKGKRKSR